MQTPRLGFLVILATYTLATRWIPYLVNLFQTDIATNPGTWYPWNFSPLFAFAIFFGMSVTNRRLAYGLPLAVLFVSDLGIALLTWNWENAFHPGMPLNYACFLGMIALGQLTHLTKSDSRGSAMARGFATGIAGEVCFFVITNMAVWWLGDGTKFLYPHTWAGLTTCFVAAIPFAQRSLISTPLYLCTFLGLGVNSAQPTSLSAVQKTPSNAVPA